MYAFHHQHLIVVHLQSFSALLALSRLKVVARQLHLLAVEESLHLPVEQVDVERIKTLEVVVALVIARCFLTVHEIVVERDGHRLDAVGQQLYGEPLAGSGFSARRRPCDEHHLHALACRYHVGNLRNLLFLQRLGQIDHSRGETGLHRIVEVAHGAKPQDVLPAVVLLEDFKHLVLLEQFAQHVGIVA